MGHNKPRDSLIRQGVEGERSAGLGVNRSS